MGGAHARYNPEPIADFFDMFYIGEGETVYFDLMDAYKEWKKTGEDRGISNVRHRSRAFMCRCFMRRVTMM